MIVDKYFFYNMTVMLWVDFKIGGFLRENAWQNLILWV